MLRAMGQNPTDSEVNDMINEVDVDGSGVVEFEVRTNSTKPVFKTDEHNSFPEQKLKKKSKYFCKIMPKIGRCYFR